MLEFGHDGGIQRMWQGAPWTTWRWSVIKNAAVEGPVFWRRAKAKRWVETAVARAAQRARFDYLTRVAIFDHAALPFGPFTQRQAQSRIGRDVTPFGRGKTEVSFMWPAQVAGDIVMVSPTPRWPWPRTPILEGADADRLVDELEHVASPEEIERRRDAARRFMDQVTTPKPYPARPELGCEWQRGGGAELEAAAIQGRAAARAGTGQIANPHGEGSGLRAAWAGGWCAETEDMAKAEGAAAFKAGVAFHDNPYRKGEWTPRDWLYSAWEVGYCAANNEARKADEAAEDAARNERWIGEQRGVATKSGAEAFCRGEARAANPYSDGASVRDGLRTAWDGGWRAEAAAMEEPSE